MSTIDRRRIVATKLYGYDWWPTQAQLDPMPASDVQQLPPEGEYDDCGSAKCCGTAGYAASRVPGVRHRGRCFSRRWDHDLPLV